MPSKWGDYKKMIRHKTKLKFNKDYRLNQCQQLYNHRAGLIDESRMYAPRDESEEHKALTKRIQTVDDLFDDWGCYPFMESGEIKTGGKKRKSKGLKSRKKTPRKSSKKRTKRKVTRKRSKKRSRKTTRKRSRSTRKH